MITDKDREILRRYLLGTLPAAKAERIRQRAVTDEAWAMALGEERERLEQLDQLPEVEPSGDLKERTLDRLREGASRSDRPRAPIGAFPAAVAVAAVVAAVFVAIRLSDEHREALARENLLRIGMALKMYANESRGELFPPVAPYEDVWMFDVSRVYPKYIEDISVFAAPNEPGYRARKAALERLVNESPVDWEAVTRVAGEHLAYTGWLSESPEDVRRLAAARRQIAPDEHDDNLRVDGTTFFRLREGIERFLITDINNAGQSTQAQSQVPVMFQLDDDKKDQPYVLYLDGHVEKQLSDRDVARAWYEALIGSNQ